MRPLVKFRLNPNSTLVPFHNLATYGQTHAGALILVAPVQALEWGEDLLGILRLQANAVVANAHRPPGVAAYGRQGDRRRLARLGVFQAVPYQVLIELRQEQ